MATFKYSNLDFTINGSSPDNVKATVGFGIRDTDSSGKMAEAVYDSVNFTVSAGNWPLSKAWINSQAVTAIQAKYAGATSD